MGEVTQLKQAVDLLRKLAEDKGVPRNIRKLASESIVVLNDSRFSVGLRAANVISKLDEASLDPNAPLFARTLIWQIIALLEQLRD
ncbi:MAG: UPF0147 family protein [Thermofilaceae archaeon]|nr:UPF0147 family protein [Thermofilaceae archaeon]MCX8181172.1 UPF0147 family protein [Thermofilaceae archaeon]MDW8004795.1 UPF0147 family protein [Thermofilaceae archaeon]